MGSPLPPDPYLALGVPKDADQAAIKQSYRKLVLKCHPDKVTNPDAKKAAEDKFHKVRTAYELLSDQDRRERYDAQVRLAELRTEAMERHSGKSTRSADRSAPSPYKSSHDSAAPRGSYNVRSGERVVPQYEERRPAYAATDYFDPLPRAAARKEPEHERSHRRPAVDSRDKVRGFTRETKEKDTERERRRERARRADQDERRDRDRKASAAYVEDEFDSDSDEYARTSRKMREDDEELRRARNAYREQAYRQTQEASSGQYDDPRTKKMFAAQADAWSHMRATQSRQKSEGISRPLPTRHSSSKDKFDHIEKDGKPAVVRRGSERPNYSSRDSERRISAEEPERYSSAETNSGSRRPQQLSQTRSSPPDSKPSYVEKPRAQSVQVDKDTTPDFPRVKRAETMPYNTSRRSENTVPQRNRPTEFTEGLATPATTPDYAGPFAANPTKFNYGSQYADDREYATPDGYRTEVRQPPESTRPRFARKITRTPSPVKDTRDVHGESRDSWDLRERERARTGSSRYPEHPRPEFSNSRTTSYKYTPAGVEQLERSRPSSGRATDSRDGRGPLYGEIRPSPDPSRQSYTTYDAPEEPSVKYKRPTRTDNIRVPSSYDHRQPSADRPSMSRTGSGTPTYTSARA